MDNLSYYPLGQNRIDYIVFHNPEAAYQLLYNKGFSPPDEPTELAETIKELIRVNGQAAIEDLLHIHPDKKAIAAIINPKQYCQKCQKVVVKDSSGACIGCKSNTVTDSFIAEFDGMETAELVQKKEGLLQKLQTDQSNTNLNKKVVQISKALEKRTAENSDPKPIVTSAIQLHTPPLTEQRLFVFGGIFIAGMLFGWMVTGSKSKQL